MAVMTGEATALEAGVRAYLERFMEPPPATREELEAEVQWLEPEVQIPISEALFWNPYPSFVEAVTARLKASSPSA